MRCLFALSADYGEFATANVLSRGQPFERRFALPVALAAQAKGIEGASAYGSCEALRAAIADERPDAVVLGSGYLFAINGLFGAEALAALVSELRDRRIAVATTDPWLRLFAVAPASRLAVHSVRAGREDAAQSARVMALHRRLESILGGLPHLLAVPAPHAHSCQNAAFAAQARPAGSRDEWLFVLSQQDLSYLPPDFRVVFRSRLEGLLENRRNQLRVVGPASLGRFLAESFAGEPRVEYLPSLDFVAFEEAVLRARVVAYWNALSASALYCLYHGVPPVFFGRGHQSRVCEGLYDHAVKHVYCGAPPAMLDLEAPMDPDAGALIESQGLAAWLDRIRAEYARLPQTASVLERLCSR